MDVTGNKFQHQSSTPKTVELRFLRAITKQFSEDQILGYGGFGTVYKGEKEDGEVVAVKKLINMVGMDDKQFLSEVKHLVDVCHPNIVRLEGYCYHIERVLTPYNGSLLWVDEVYRLLCFEYLPNGSLDKHLTDESSGLDWHKRYNIIEGICKGLHYLHEGRRGAPILHLDLKPSNILLDKNMVPKIADFGLSRLFGEEKTHTCTMNLRGSFGYMPPEYIEKRMISKESDIFSLGVIIVEIVTGHRKYPDDTTTQEFIEVPEKWRRRLQTTSNYTSLEEDCRQVNQCIEVGLKCMERKPKKRPNIREIIEMLNGSENTNSCSVREDGHELKAYQNEEGNVMLLFNRVHQLVGAVFDGNYVTYDKFDPAQEALVNKLKECAHDKLEDISFDYVMKNNFPEPICSSSNTADGPSFPNPSDHDMLRQGTAAAENLGPDEVNCVAEPLPQTEKCDPPGPAYSYAPFEDASLDFSVHLESGSGTQYPTTANDITDSLTLHCPNTTSNEIAGSVVFGQAALAMGHWAYDMPFANRATPVLPLFQQKQPLPDLNDMLVADTPVLPLFQQEQPLPAQHHAPSCPLNAQHHAPSCPLNAAADTCVLCRDSSFQPRNFRVTLEHWEHNQMFEDWFLYTFSAPSANELPADVHCNGAKPLSHGKWIKLAVLARFLSLLRACREEHA